MLIVSIVIVVTGFGSVIYNQYLESKTNNNNGRGINLMFI